MLAQTNHNLEAYWENPEATADAQADNWFHTGDGGTFEDGYLSISDRKKDVIITGGENVSSIEVEDTLMSHDAVTEVAVIGIPDEKWGELVTALVVLDPDAGEVTEDELIAHCRENLAGYKTPEADRVPRRARPHRHRQAAEVQAAPGVLGGPRPPGPLARRASACPPRR